MTGKKLSKFRGKLPSWKLIAVFIFTPLLLAWLVSLLAQHLANNQTALQSVVPTASSALESESISNVSELINITPIEPGLAGLKKHFVLVEKASAKNVPLPMEYTLGPTANPENAELVRSRFQDKLKFFQSLGLKSLDMHWVIASEKDHDWWVEFRKNQFADYPVDLWDTKQNMLGHCTLDPDIFCGAGNGVNNGFYQDNVIGTEFTDRGLNHVTRHEATHFYQSSIGFIDICWFVEGQATFFETYLEPSARSRDQVIDRLIKSPTKVALSTQKEFERKLNRNSICDADPDIRYDLGMLVFEYMYTNYSIKDIHNLLVETNKTSWQEATKSVLSIESGDLNNQIAAYLFAQLASARS